MKNKFTNLTRFQILNLFPINLPCKCELSHLHTTYDAIFSYHVGHCETWIDKITITCNQCNNSKTYDVSYLKISLNEIDW
ncbi:MAG: hypothetical protein E7311_07190 [Clostridiales bacterium]|nr:hypothetical protein [Clostridiales bacterium]